MLMNNKTKFFAGLALSILSLSAHAEKIALVDGTLIDPSRNEVRQPSTNTSIIIDGDRIERIAPKILETGTRVIDCKGKFILPGYIDTHIHFFQSADLFTRPDIVNLNSVRPYRDEVAWIKSHLDDTFARYLRSGITSVVDVGGPFWNFDVRKRANSTAEAPRVAVAGPLISSVARPHLDLSHPPDVH